MKEKTTIKDKIVTDYYRVLEILYKHQITVGDKIYSPITQQEVADILSLHKMTINAIFKELKDDGLVIQEQGRKRTYYLSEQAVSICKKIAQIKN